MAHLLVRRVAAISGTCAETGRYLHRMNERHPQNVDIEIDRRFHVVSAECKMMDVPWYW
jgi:hypothetical protein